MSKLYKDRIVNESDGKSRFNLVDRNGKIVATEVRLELASEVLQEGDRYGSPEMNTFIERSDDGQILTSKFIIKEDY